MSDKNRTLISRLHESRTVILLAALLVVVTLAAFWRVTGNEFISFDDNKYITENPAMEYGLTRATIRWAFGTYMNANWHPVTWMSHLLDARLFGLEPSAHHAMNLAIHVLNVLLLFWVLHRMTRSVGKSAFVAALFAVHPLHVESVAWAAERKDVLSTFFWLLTMLAYARYADKPSRVGFIAVMAAFGLGLLAKPMLVTLPLVLLLMDAWPLKRFRFMNSDSRTSIADLIYEKVPLFAMVAYSCYKTLIAQRMGGAVADADLLAMGVRAANAVVAYVGYIAKMLVPRNLALFYPHPENHLPQWHVVGSVVLLVLITVFVLRMVRTKPYLAFGWLWYVITLIPVVGLVQVGEQAMADRYTYVPLTGLFIMIAWGVPDLLRVKGKAPRLGLAVAASVIVLILSALTWVQVGHWQDDFTLTEHAIAVTGDNYMMHMVRAVAFQKANQLDEAKDEYLEVVRLAPYMVQPHNNLATIYYLNGEYAKAWQEVHECEKLGFTPLKRFTDELSIMMPEPER